MAARCTKLGINVEGGAAACLEDAPLAELGSLRMCCAGRCWASLSAMHMRMADRLVRSSGGLVVTVVEGSE